MAKLSGENAFTEENKVQNKKDVHAGEHSILSVAELKKQLRDDGICLRKAAKNAALEEHPDTAQHWLADNFHLLEAVRTDCLHALKNTALPPFAKPVAVSDTGSAGGLFLRCLSLCTDGKLPASKDIAVFFTKHALCTAGCILLPAMLRCALLHTAANAVRCKQNDILIAGIRSLLRLRSFDFDALQREVSPVEQILRQDPAGVYENMDSETKNAYRKQITILALREGKDEESTALDILNQAKEENKHIGFFLDFKPKDSKKAVIFTAAQAFFAILLSVLSAWGLHVWWSIPLTTLPFYAVLQPIFDRLTDVFFTQESLFSMQPQREIKEEDRTLLTVCGLLPKAADMLKTEKHLASIYESEGFGAVQVLFLADMSEADAPEMPQDEPDITAMKRSIDRLNARFGGGFVLAIRPRVFSPTQQKYAGKERKRGALLALSALLTGNGDGGFCVLHGDTKNLKNTKYILTLDSDTTLSFGCLARLCAVASHPLNHPQTDLAKRSVTKGYGILVPCAQTALTENDASFFTNRMTGHGGMGAYAGGVGERNMTLFGKSVFTGKGLVHVQTFYDLCADRFPEQRILSHDVLEGGILHAGYENRVAFCEHFPDHERSYFERMHRWLRGDWQNASFVFRPLGHSLLPVHTRWLLADNLRRALTPIAALLLLFVSLTQHGLSQNILAAIALFSVCAGEAFASIAAVFSQVFFALQNRCTAIHRAGLGETAIQMLLQCAMLPQTAAVCIWALVQSIWRLCVSKRNLLAWKTAAHSDKHASRQYFSTLIFPLFAASVLFWGSIVCKLTALLFLINIPLALGFSLPQTAKRNVLTPAQKDRLLADCASMWQFFEEQANKENHFLPPDNIQQTPLKKVAHRTSPTNIGLYLCSMLAAADLAFMDAQKLCECVRRCLDSIEQLEKRNGHLLNWYNTKTLAPLPPFYVSTVDSGNFVCCLTALREGLCEYTAACPALQKEIERIDKYLQAVDFKPLYDPLRKLFFVGMDAQTGEKSESCYDLYMSEARMTSYWCVSAGVVPAEHWKALGRTPVCTDSAFGALSWTGTFFEYFMPCLFLPVRPHSFAAVSLRCCLLAQKKYADRKKIPWGITESGFYEFDPAMNYSYKAHGIAALALKHRADCEPVVAPYASFLALPLFPKEAMRNLNRLRNMDMTSRYGFFEAADFTKKRTGGEDYCVVRSYMAHHVGMSLLSSVNALQGNVFVHRFMRSPRTAPAVQLLNERFDTHTKPFRDIRKKEDIARPVRPDAKSQIAPKNIGIFANGEWTLLCDRTGRNVHLFSAHQLLRTQRFGAGISAACIADGKIFPLAGHPSLQNRFTNGCTTSSAQTDTVKIFTAQAVHPQISASLFAVRTENTANTPQTAQLCFYLEPFLQAVFQKQAHPAYEKLFIDCTYDEDEKIFIFTRRTEDTTFCMAVGLWDNTAFTFETDREKVLDRGGADRFCITDTFLNLQNGLRGTDRCLALCIPVNLQSAQSTEHTLIVTAAENEKEAASRLRRIRANPLPDSRKCARNPFAEDAVLLQSAENLCASLFFDAAPTEAVRYARSQNTEGREALWSLGISGDKPIAVLETDSREQPQMLDTFVRLHAKLCSVGLPFDFVFLRGRTGGYSESAQEVLQESVRRVALPHAGGNLFALQKNTFPVETLRTLCAFAQLIFPLHFDTVCLPRFREPLPILPLQTPPKQSGFIQNGYCIAEQPRVPWCQVYANSVFGFLAEDNALGFTWAGNSSLNKITPWRNDTRNHADSEELLLGTDEKIYSLTRGAVCSFTDTQALYEGETDALRTTVFVSSDTKAQMKRLTVRLHNTAETEKTAFLVYKILPLLGEHIADARFVTAKIKNGGILLHNPVNTAVPGYAGLFCNGENPSFAFNEAQLLSVLQGKEKADYKLETEAFFAELAAVCARVQIPPAASVSVQFSLVFARTKEALSAVKDLALRTATPVRACFSTGNATLDRFGNALLLHTVLHARFYGRCGFFQCGGAWGFRDQLQDALCLLPYYPHLTRRQLLRCAAVQFLQGDVLHWHHALFPKNAEKTVYRGVRTRCSDDFLWLPFVTAKYVLQTKDTDVLQTRISYLDAPPLQKGEKDRYSEYHHADIKETLYSHCLRAVARGLRFGTHGLSLMLGGDWNDAMGSVGEHGKGESVWLSMFLAQTLELFSHVCDLQKEPHNAIRLRKLAAAVRSNIDRSAWENDRYLRAFFDDGTPLGSENGTACKLDILPQAFAVFCNMPDKKRVRTALATAYNTLFDPTVGIVKLFDPPFTPQDKKAGYINRYPAGVRENGGQYTHAAVWFCMALYHAGYPEQAKQVALSICPAGRYEDGLHTPQADTYRCEPYAPCGDVASASGLQGRGGWSLYTGSAGWLLELLRLLSES